ncbi:MAG: hypothetical protein ABSD27_04080 [Bryobacteraceae bacterium]
MRLGLPRISRYHAADCASLHGEFEGWDEERQISFSKHLIGIIAKHKPFGMAFGASLEDYAAVFPELSEHQQRIQCYKFCADRCFNELALVMQRCFPNEGVVVFHDSGDFVAPAFEAFRHYETNPQFVSFAPLPWRRCPAMQPADLLAYEGVKLADRRLQGDEYIRKSMQAIMGEQVPMSVAYIRRGAFQEVMDRMVATGEGLRGTV